MQRSIFYSLILACLFSFSSELSALPLQSNHGSIQVVPAPGAVTIDGSLEDWDRSGEMFVYRARDIRDRYSVRVYAMWDQDCFYLAMHFKDPTPMYNNVDPVGAPASGWMSDSFQGRFITDYKEIHLTAWYSSKYDKSVFALEYDSPGNPEGAVVERGEGTMLKGASGVEMAFKKDADNRGYVQEMKIPWKLLYKKAPEKLGSGLAMGFTGEYYWGGALGDKWPHALYSDPINQENPVRVVVYQSPAVWGKAELLDTGNLPPPEDDGAFDLKLQGLVPLRFELPATAMNFTVVIDDSQGRRVRNLLSNARVEEYLVETKDGKKIVEALWDGRVEGEFDKDRNIFVGEIAPAGEYSVRAVAHSGIGVVHAGSFYNPGTPPWPTADKKGGWGFDHGAPVAVGAMPKGAKGAARVFLGWPSGEGGMGFLGLDDTGRKIWHWYRQGTGAEHFATTDKHVYFIFQKNKVGRVNPDDGEQVPFANGQQDVTVESEQLTGIAVHEKEFAVSDGKTGQIIFHDAEKGDKLREVKVSAPGQIVFAANGDLIGIAEEKTFFRIQAGSATVEPFTLEGVVEPRSLAFDTAGKLYVTDASAKAQNVKVYERAGAEAKLIGQIGEAGGHLPGPWNPMRMNNPHSIAIEEPADGTVKVWVCESSNLPRRFSVWTPEGNLIRDYLGNTGYSGSGGALSDNIPTLGLFNGYRAGTMLFDIDYPAHAFRLINIVGDPNPVPEGKHQLFRSGMGIGDFANPNHLISSVSGQSREYLIEGNGQVCLIFMKRGDYWIPAAALGAAARGFKFPEGFPQAPSQNAIFSWADKNGDGYQSPDEVTWWDPGRPGVLNMGWGGRCYADLVWYNGGYAIKPHGYNEIGAPLYDVSKAELLPGQLGKAAGDIYKTKSGYVTYEDSQFPGLFRKDFVGYDTDGNQKWRYPSWWDGVHGAFTAPVPTPGIIIGLMKITGVFEQGGQSVISIRGNMGQEFLLREDGVFLSELFTDNRMVPSEWPSEQDMVKMIGVPINDTTLREEPFSGYIGRQDDGRVRMTAGEQDVRIAEVTGMDTITNLPAFTLKLTEEMVAKNRTFQPKRSGPEKTTEYLVRKGGAITAEEKSFTGDDVIKIYAGRDELGRAVARYDQDHLYVAWQVFDETAMVNEGIDKAYAYKSGDSVSFFFADRESQDGREIFGARLLLTMLKGQPLVMEYRPKGPGDAPFTFESPVRSITFQYVAENPDVKFAVTPGNMFYIVTATIPWKVIGVTPGTGTTFKADMGIIFGRMDTTGYVQRRVQWVDEENMIVNDAPTEAEFFPARWGTFKLE
ncbi:sugar-binding protein [Kamptonema cortianum]|nr:sugar-binding protein [Kamptonema cortianum]